MASRDDDRFRVKPGAPKGGAGAGNGQRDSPRRRTAATEGLATRAVRPTDVKRKPSAASCSQAAVTVVRETQGLPQGLV